MIIQQPKTNLGFWRRRIELSVALEVQKQARRQPRAEFIGTHHRGNEQQRVFQCQLHKLVVLGVGGQLLHQHIVVAQHQLIARWLGAALRREHDNSVSSARAGAHHRRRQRVQRRVKARRHSQHQATICCIQDEIAAGD